MMNQFTVGDVVTVYGLKYSESRPHGQFLGIWNDRNGSQAGEFPEHAWPLTVGNAQEGKELTVADFSSGGVLCKWLDEKSGPLQAVFPAAVLRRKPTLSDLGAELA